MFEMNLRGLIIKQEKLEEETGLACVGEDTEKIIIIAKVMAW